MDVGRDLGAAAPLDVVEDWLGGLRTVLLFSVATLLARAWPGPEEVAAAAVRLCAGTPPDVVGLDGTDPAAGVRVLVAPGSLVEDVLDRPEDDDAAADLVRGPVAGLEDDDDTSRCRTEELDVAGDDDDDDAGGWRDVRESRLDIGFGFFFFAAASLRLPPETVRVAGRARAALRGAGRRLGEPAEAGFDAAAAEEEEDDVEVAGRSVVEPCVGFRKERARLSEDDIVLRFAFGGWRERDQKYTIRSIGVTSRPGAIGGATGSSEYS